MMVDLIGFGGIVWVTKKLVESGIDSHFDEQEFALEEEFRYHLHRRKLEQENERYLQFLSILKYWARYEKLILFRQRFIAELRRCIGRSSQADTEVLEFLDSLIQDRNEDQRRPNVYWVMEMLARAGQVVHSSQCSEFGSVLFHLVERNRNPNSGNALLEYIELFFSYEKMWLKVQENFFRHCCEERNLELEYFRAIEDVVHTDRLL